MGEMLSRRRADADAHARHAAGRPVARQACCRRRRSRSSTSRSRPRAADRAAEAVQALDARATLHGLEWQKAGFDADLGLDKHFYDIAKPTANRCRDSRRSTTRSRASTRCRWSSRTAAVGNAEGARHANRQSVTELADAWKAGDAATVERIVLEDLKSEPVMYERLLVERNRNWLPKIEALFARPQPSIRRRRRRAPVGPDGLLQMLKAKGYTVEQQSSMTCCRRHPVISAASPCSSPAPASPALPRRATRALGADGHRRRRSRPRRRPRPAPSATGSPNAQHAEAGGDMIDEEHDALRALAARARPDAHADSAHGLRIRARRTATDGPHRRARTRARGWERLAERCRRSLRRLPAGRTALGLADRAELARRSVASGSTRFTRTRNCGRRPPACAGSSSPIPTSCRCSRWSISSRAKPTAAPGTMYRIEGGNDRLATALAAPLGDRLRLNTELVAVSHRGRGVRASVKHGTQAGADPGRLPRVRAAGDACSAAFRSRRRFPPRSTTRSRSSGTAASPRRCCSFPALLAAAGRPRAFGSPLPFGAVWDGNEEQRGRAGILALLAGGSASDATRRSSSREGIDGLVSIARLARSNGANSSPRARSPGSPTRGLAAATRFSIRRSIRRCAPGWRALRAALLRRRAHEHPVAGLHERRGRKRPAGGRRSRRFPPTESLAWRHPRGRAPSGRSTR